MYQLHSYQQKYKTELEKSIQLHQNAPYITRCSHKHLQLLETPAEPITMDMSVNNIIKLPSTCFTTGAGMWQLLVSLTLRPLF